MTDHRTSRLNEQFKREISAILSRKVRDPRVGPLLITDVRVTPDLWVARVFFRPLDPDRDPEDVGQGLATAAPFVRRELGKVLKIRRIPELRFQFDTTIDSALRIEAVLKEVLSEEEDGQFRPGKGPEEEGTAPLPSDGEES